MTRPHKAELLLISGSVRAGSTNTSALHTVRDMLGADVTTTLYAGLGALPHFNPDDDHDPLPPVVADLREAIRTADGLLFCTPEYAGDMPGALKNLLEWTVGGVEIEQKATGWINVSAAPAGAASTHAMLRTVLTYTGAAVVDDACVHVPVARQAIDADGIIRDPDIRAGFAAALDALIARAGDAGDPPP